MQATGWVLCGDESTDEAWVLNNGGAHDGEQHICQDEHGNIGTTEASQGGRICSTAKGNPKQFYLNRCVRRVKIAAMKVRVELIDSAGSVLTQAMASSGMQSTASRSRPVPAFSNRPEKYIQRDGCGLSSAQLGYWPAIKI